MAGIKLNKPSQTDPTLEELLDGQKEPEATKQEKEATKQEPEAKGKYITIYTRVGKPFDPNTGKERPTKKHVVSKLWWLANKDRLNRLGYNVIRKEGE